MRSKWYYRMIWLVCSVLGVCSQAEIVTVGQGEGNYDYDNLSEALFRCEEGDDVVVAPGTYQGLKNTSLTFFTKKITVRSEQGPETCIIDCENIHTGFLFEYDRPDALLSGFTIKNANGQDGGAIKIEVSGPKIENCIFLDNRSQEDGGAVAIDAITTVSLKGCVFMGNEAKDDGGAVMTQGEAPVYLINCRFIQNKARDNGGAVFSRYGTLYVMQSFFAGNVARANGGAVYCRDNVAYLNNSAFSGNEALDDGGALYVRDSQDPLGLLNCTLTRNKAGLQGGGIAYASGRNSTRLYGCIVWENEDYGGTGLTSQLSGLYYWPDYSCVQGWIDTSDDEGMIAGDPLFTDVDGPDNQVGTVDDDLRLLAGSPCIDNTLLTHVSAPLTLDLAHANRLYGSAVDMGAYEYGSDGMDPNESETCPMDQPPVIVTEVLTHSSNGPDWVELYNRTDKPVCIGGWFLSDNPRRYDKYEIAWDTVIEPNEYLVLNQSDHFQNNQDPGFRIGFGFSSSGGEQISLCSACAGIPTGWHEHALLEAAPRQQSLARYEDSLGAVDYMLTQENTPGSHNAPADVGPVIVSEIMYLSYEPGGEYVELWNISDAPVTLYQADMDQPAKLGGNLFEFPKAQPVSLAPGERLIVAQNPEALKARYTGQLDSVQVLGPLNRDLPDVRGGVEVLIPEVTSFGWIVSDRVNYNRDELDLSIGFSSRWKLYWPSLNDGQGHALTRINPDQLGNEPLNWEAAPPTPGY